MKPITERLRNVVSYSEIQGIKQVVEALNGTDEGIVIASNLADRAKITRGVIVNGMKLLEAAGVVETKSLGMKGTYIKITDKNTLNELIS